MTPWHRPGCNLQALLRAGLVGTLAWQAGTGTLRATELLMKDGRLLIGKLGYVSSLGNPDHTPEAVSKKDTVPIALLDDDLRRTFVPKQQKIQDARPDSQLQVPEKFRVHQPAKSSGPRYTVTAPSSTSVPSTNSAAAPSP